MSSSDPENQEVSASIFLQVIYPDFLYEIQDKFKEHGIYFIDLNTGLIIKGNINIDTLGMITKKSFKKTKKAKNNSHRYLIPPEVQTIFDIEAVINVFQPTNSNEPFAITIQVIDQRDLPIWQKICIDIGQDYLYQLPDGQIDSTVKIQLIPLTLPNKRDPQSAIQAMLGNIQQYNTTEKSDLSALPGYAYPSLDSEYGDEELDP